MEDNTDLNAALIAALRKKAMGYVVSETTTEYDGEGNELKNRVTVKEVPPDLSAIKMLLELENGEREPDEEELAAEKEKLLLQLGEIIKGEKNGTRKM